MIWVWLDSILGSTYGAAAFAPRYASAEAVGALMDREDLPPSTEVGRLDARIRRARDAGNGRASEGSPPVGLGWAMRLTTEMFAALIVGGGLGWLVDEWLGTRPWLMLVFLVVGCAAGMLNAYRVARRFETGTKS